MHNVGTVDRVLRVIIGLAIISLAFWGPKSPWAWLGVIPIASALIGWCPLYTVLGIRTCRMRATD